MALLANVKIIDVCSRTSLSERSSGKYGIWADVKYIILLTTSDKLHDSIWKLVAFAQT